MADDPLEKLAAKGRELAAVARARELRAERSSLTEEERDARARLRGSVSPFCRWGWWVWGSLLGVTMLPLAAVAAPFMPASWFGDGTDESIAGMLFIAMLAVPALVLRTVRAPIGERALVRESRRLQSLPFPVAGYFEALAKRSTEGRATLTIVFAPPAATTAAPSASYRSSATEPAASLPDDAEIEAIFRTIYGRLGKSSDPLTRDVHHEVDTGDTTLFTNAHLARWYWKAFRIAVLLHERHPIAQVRVTGFGR
jgi:hypothetical protein